MTNKVGEMYLLVSLEYIADWLRRVVETVKNLNGTLEIDGLMGRLDNDKHYVFT